MAPGDTATRIDRHARARRAKRTAVAQTLLGLGIDWAILDELPDWLALRHGQERDRLCAHAGGWWLAASLRACIDGKRLAQVSELLGENELNLLRESAQVERAEALEQVPRPLLPPAQDVPNHLMACGRALLAWRLPSALRSAILERLGWAVDESHYSAFEAHAAWAERALMTAQHECGDRSASYLPHDPSDRELQAIEQLTHAQVGSADLELCALEQSQSADEEEMPGEVSEVDPS